MNRLQSELQRLYHSPEAGQVRAMVLEVGRPASWDALGKAWRGVQADLGLPAPAIAVSGADAFQLWFSLAQPVPAQQAMDFLDALRRRYLGELAPERVRMHHGAVLPPLEASPGRWSAFVAPDLAGIFADEPWLDLPPGPEAQAELLSRLESIKPQELAAAANEAPAPAASAPTFAAAPEAGHAGSPAPSIAGGADPRRFLLEVMNDRAVDLRLRIEAAKALLPYVEGQPP
ncbi:hypothetical protein ACFPOE_22300 [Caenimonas terrae]|uniref:Uncharacterized protein n=1 Tax=Caenimonas terrae TaxID=696074 RepID=A0ABW0NJW8_9BURK